MTAGTKRPKPPPKDLKVSGKALWRSIVGQYALDPAETVLLHQLGRAVDVLDLLYADLATMSVTVSGSTGQPKVNPLLAEIREHVKLIDVLQMALALPVAGEQVGRRRSAQVKAAARSPRKIKSKSRISRISALQRKDGALDVSSATSA